MGTILTEVESFDSVKIPNPLEPVRASGGVGVPYTIEGATPDGDITYTARISNVRVRHLGGINKALSVTHSGSDVTIQLQTDLAGAILSSAKDVISKIKLTPSVLAMIHAIFSGTGDGIVSVSDINFMKIGSGIFGSIRPALQALTNRTRWLFKYTKGWLDGTVSFKSIVVDLVGGQPVTPTPGRVTAHEGVFSSLVSAPQFQTLKSQGSNSLPNPTVPLGLLNLSNTLIGVAFVQVLPAPGIALYWGMNVNSISHPKTGECLITFNINCSHAIPIAMSHGNALFVLSQAYVLSLSPLTIKIIQAYPNTLSAANQDFVLYVVGE